MLLRLQRAWWADHTSDGLEVYSLLRRRRLLLRGDADALASLTDALVNGVDAFNPVEILTQKTSLSSETVERILSALEKAGALIKAPETKENPSDMLDRQALFFDMFERSGLSGADFNNNLRKRSVGIVGIGGYGSWLAMLCARVGIGTIVLVDADKVELTNLNRQILFDEDDISRSKADVARDAIKKINPKLVCKSYPLKVCNELDLLQIIDGTDLVFNTFGYDHTKLVTAISSACHKAHVPYLTFSGSWVGPLTIPGKTPCINCARKAIEAQKSISRAVTNYSRSTLVSAFPSFGPRIGFSSCLAVWEAIRFLAGLDEPPTTRGIIVHDFFGYTDHGFIALTAELEACTCSCRVRSANQAN